MKAHNFADIFPLMNTKEFKELKEDIKQHGQLDPIITYQGKILDGRNRYQACVEVGVTPKTIEFKGKDALQYVMSTNLKRRHLTDSQKAVVGIKYKKYYKKIYKHGGDRQVGTGSHLVDDGTTHNRDKAGKVVGIKYKKYYSIWAKKRQVQSNVEPVPQENQSRARDKAGKVVGIKYKKYYAKQYPQGRHHKELVPNEQSRDKAGKVVGIKYKKYYSIWAKKRMLSGKKADPSEPVREGKASDQAGEIVGVSGKYIDMAEKKEKNKRGREK